MALQKALKKCQNWSVMSSNIRILTEKSEIGSELICPSPIKLSLIFLGFITESQRCW